MDEKTVKIGVLSDTHLSGYDEGLKRIVQAHFKSVDLIFHAGDLVDMRVLDVFEGRQVKAVRGNMDSPGVRQALPEQLVMEIGGFKIALIHGWGAPDGMERKLANHFGKMDCIVYGHTHYPANKTVDGTLFFNPGSAMDKRFAPYRSVGVIEVGREITGRIVQIE
ncbi:MAG: metallophosphoesterase family protein [Smithellaceae bacterium]